MLKWLQVDNLYPSILIYDKYYQLYLQQDTNLDDLKSGKYYLCKKCKCELVRNILSDIKVARTGTIFQKRL